MDLLTDELRAKARKVDEELDYLERKVASVSNIGLTPNPERMKRKGLNVLQELHKDLKDMESGSRQMIEDATETYTSYSDSNMEIAEFIKNISNELDSYERQLQANNKDYKLFHEQETSNVTISESQVNGDISQNIHSFDASLRNPSGFDQMLSVNDSHSESMFNEVPQMTPINRQNEARRRPMFVERCIRRDARPEPPVEHTLTVDGFRRETMSLEDFRMANEELRRGTLLADDFRRETIVARRETMVEQKRPDGRPTTPVAPTVSEASLKLLGKSCKANRVLQKVAELRYNRN